MNTEILNNSNEENIKKEITEYEFNTALENDDIETLKMVKTNNNFSLFRPVKLLSALRKYPNNEELIKLLINVSKEDIKKLLNKSCIYGINIDIFIELLEINSIIDIDDDLNYITDKIKINDTYKFYIDQIFKTDFKAKNKIDDYRKKYGISHKYNVINSNNTWYLTCILENFLRRGNKDWFSKIMPILKGRKNDWGSYCDIYIGDLLNYLFYNHTDIDKLIADTDYILVNTESYKEGKFDYFHNIFTNYCECNYSDNIESRNLFFIFKNNKRIKEYCQYILKMAHCQRSMDIADIFRLFIYDDLYEIIIDSIEKYNYTLDTKMYEKNYNHILLSEVLIDAIKNSIKVEQYRYLIKMIDYNIKYVKENISNILEFSIRHNIKAFHIVDSLICDSNKNYNKLLVESFKEEKFDIFDVIYKKINEISFNDIYKILLKKNIDIYKKILKYNINFKYSNLYYFFSKLLENEEKDKIELLFNDERFKKIGFKISF
jgi:hypothetical protein